LLIQQGARPLLEPYELLDYLNLERVVEHRAARNMIPADPIEAEILKLIDEEALNLDDICSRSNQSIEQISAALSIMELKGMVRRDSGLRYEAIHESSPEYTVA
jgi:DNA processing protein